MRLLLVRPSPHPDTIGLQHIMVCEPLELEYMGAIAREKNWEVKILDMILEPPEALWKELEQFFPDLVGFTSYIAHVGIVKDLALQIKKRYPQIKIVVGGVHAEVCKEDFFPSQIDYLIGENAFFSFKYLLENFSKKENLPSVLDSSTLPDFIPLSQMFSALPRPARDLTRKYRSSYYYVFHPPPAALIKTTFGCPFNCNFCFCIRITKGKYWQRPIEDVVDELREIEEEEVYIVDDNFLFDVERLKRFFELLDKYKIKKHYLVYGRADFIAAFPEVIKEFKKRGLKTVIIGYESFREEELKSYHKRASVNTYFIATRILQNLDIDIYGTFILDHDWGISDFWDLFKYIKKLNLRFVNLQPLAPLKGTGLFEKFKKRLFISPEEYHKWDMAHLLIKPGKISVRLYYFLILAVYLLVSFNYSATVKNIKKYGWRELVKISLGVRKVIWQYIWKIIQGK